MRRADRRIGKMFADGNAIGSEHYAARRVYLGDTTQSADPLIAATEGLAPRLSRPCLCGAGTLRDHALRQSAAQLLVRTHRLKVRAVAQLVLTVAGAWAGNAIGGGLGQAAGAMLGSYLGAAIEQDLFGPGPSPITKVEGARVTDLQVSGSAYGQPIPRVWGRGRIAANIIWVRGIKETVITETETTGGGGKGSASRVVVDKPRCARAMSTRPTSCSASAKAGHGGLPIWVNNTMLDPEHVGAIRVGYGETTSRPIR